MRCVTRPFVKLRAFTLIELLVVVAIIALLISILLPSLTAARNTARTVRCQANLKQFGNAHLMYANQADNYYVPHRLNRFGLQWYRNIMWRKMLGIRDGGSIPEGLRCPSALEDRKHRWAHNYGGNGQRHGSRTDLAPVIEKLTFNEGDYRRNRNTTGVNDGLRFLRSKILRPSGVLQVIDASDWNLNRGGARYDQRYDIHGEQNGSGHAIWGGGRWNMTAYRHNQGANLLMFDGHAEYRPKTEVWFYKANGTSTNWGPLNRLWQAYRRR